MDTPKQTEQDLLAGLPPSALFDLARNGSARWSARKKAVALLIETSDPRAKHPELAELVYAVAAETLGAAESLPNEKSDTQESFPFDVSAPGPFRTSVTTETLFRDDGKPYPEKPRLPQQPIVSVDVPALEPLPVTSPAPALYDPEQ